ncbi:MAG: large subunit ribosomal protein L34e [Candidatus Woesearchaeota archaeon]|nr:large subunit ribosomal protein L34e [Candidatus Woesearchaeota archaeon]MDI3543794.1 large subunit ribosomal protein L34e [Candidatus Woesearchaeota archaeon]
MTQRIHKSNSLRTVYKKVPGGALKTHYEARNPSKAHCAICGKPLPGVESKRSAKLKKLSKTEKRPSRPYGGMLCSSCSRKKIIEVARKNL